MCINLLHIKEAFLYHFADTTAYTGCQHITSGNDYTGSVVISVYTLGFTCKLPTLVTTMK